MKHKKIMVNDAVFSNAAPLTYIAGPCVIESEKEFFEIAEKLKKIFKKTNSSFILKASFDKANRTSHKSFRGVGLEKGLEIIRGVKSLLNLKVLVDVHEPRQAQKVAEVADILQIPAFLCRQTDLLFACADTGKTINIKKGQFLSPWNMVNAVKKIESRGNKSILLTERGSMFGYFDLVVDMRSIEIMKKTGYPVIFDCTHSVQKPGNLGNASGGNIEFALSLAKAATALSIAGIFFETHKNPEKALSDGPNSLKLSIVESAVNMLNSIDKVIKGKFQ